MRAMSHRFGGMRTLQHVFLCALASLVLFAAPASAAERKIDIGASGICALKTSGVPACWSFQAWLDPRHGPLSAVSVGGTQHMGDDEVWSGVCALKVDGTPVCDPYSGARLPQYQVPSYLEKAIAIDAGDDYTCAIDASDNRLVCWGGSPVGGYDGAVKAVSVGSTEDGSVTCAIRTDDTPICFGEFYFRSPSTPPTDIGTVKAIDVGGYHACAIRTDGTPVCWGDNVYGESDPPDDVGEVISIDASRDFTCAVKTNGTPVCWGDSRFGRLDIPAGVGPLKSIVAPSTERCGIRTNGYAQCWDSTGNVRKYEPAPAGPQPPYGQQGVPYSHQFTSPAPPGLPATMHARTNGQVPPGLAMRPRSGRLSGTPTTPGTYTFTVRADNGIFRPVDRTFTMEISDDPPANTSRPRIIGTPKAGGRLHVEAGTWTGYPTYRFQWVRCDQTGNDCAGLRGATAGGYDLGADDVGSRMRVRVIATNPAGTTRKVSAPTAVVAPG